MSIKPPGVPFEVGADLQRHVDSAKVMLDRIRSAGGEDTLRVLSKIIWIERSLRELAHGDILKRADMNGSQQAMFPAYREFNDGNYYKGTEETKHHEIPGEPLKVRLVVHDLCVVWNGESWEGDGACSFNRMVKENSTGKWPKRACIMHASWAPWGTVGEMIAESRQLIPSNQWFTVTGMKPGDYLVGELYLSIC